MIYAIAAVLVLIVDQAVKFWTTKSIPMNDIVEFIPGVLRLTNIHNYGAAFNILQNARWFLIAITFVFIIGIIVLMTQEVIHTKFGRWTMTMILAGAIGNCIDRMLYGYVVDMFELEFMTFPVFNVADIFITVFGILFCIHVVLHNEPEEVKAANEPAFMRRRREAREAAAMEEAHVVVPKRGEHKPLEEELRAENPNDLFGEWGFGEVVRQEKSETSPAAEKASAPVFELKNEPEPAPEAPKAAAPEEDMFSLDDILAEFGDY